MKEVVFINRNIKKWQNIEYMFVNTKRVKADDLADSFIKLTDDLAFSQTYYPQSETTQYLNALTLKAHTLIYKNKKEKSDRIVKFWKYEFPELMFKHKKFLLYSLMIFLFSAIVGAFSAWQDVDFIRLIMGDGYVNMTLENIENGDPMAVYKNANNVEMFLGITINNIKVSFWAFILGIFVSIGTGWILFNNGIMVGSFLFFMADNDALYNSVLAIFMHGTLELFAIVVAGAAGILIGNSLLFPKTYSRLNSFRKAFKEGLKIVLGLAPFFVIAGFIEGFITRFTLIPDVFRIIFILSSVVFITWYFFLYPSFLMKNKKPKLLT